MHVLMTVVPEIEAEFFGGSLEMTKYLKENIIYKIPETVPKQFNGIAVFTVNENGEISNAKISNTSGDSKIDELLLEAAYKMPKWKPAENSKGIKVKQEFEIIIGKGGGC
jgi:TonB family protein